MYQANITQELEVANKMKVFTSFPVAVEVQTDPKNSQLLAELSPENAWGDRKNATLEFGYTRSPEAPPGLLNALKVDPFWMVRCAIIQALEMISDAGAVPTLREASKNDGFQALRSYAAKAVEGFPSRGKKPKRKGVINLGVCLGCAAREMRRGKTTC